MRGAARSDHELHTRHICTPVCMTSALNMLYEKDPQARNRENYVSGVIPERECDEGNMELCKPLELSCSGFITNRPVFCL